MRNHASAEREARNAERPVNSPLRTPRSALRACGACLWLLAIAYWLCAPAAHAQGLKAAATRECIGVVSNHVLVTRSTRVFSAEINNFSGGTLYLLVFDSATNMLAGATPHFAAVPVPTGSVGGKDWGLAGAPFNNGVNVCLSTTPFSLTNATTGGTVTVLHTP